jgi:hypothetical protein
MRPGWPIAVTISRQVEETGPGQFTNIALRLLEKAPDRVKAARVPFSVG